MEQVLHGARGLRVSRADLGPKLSRLPLLLYVTSVGGYMHHDLMFTQELLRRTQATQDEA